MRNRPLAAPDESLADLRLERRADLLRVLPIGEWNIGQVPRLDVMLQGLKTDSAREAEIDASGVSELDTAGAWLLLRTKNELESAGVHVRGPEVPERYVPLVQTMEAEKITGPIRAPQPKRGFFNFLERLGRGTSHALGQG